MCVVQPLKSWLVLTHLPIFMSGEICDVVQPKQFTTVKFMLIVVVIVALLVDYQQAKMSILRVLRAVVTRKTNLFLVERIVSESKYFKLYHCTSAVLFCLFVSNFKSRFKRYVHSKSLIFNRSYVVEHKKRCYRNSICSPFGDLPHLSTRNGRK